MEHVSKKYPQIKAYKLKDGTELFRFTVYLGVNPLNGKEQAVTRSKFKTVKQAELAIEKLKFEFSNGVNPANMQKTYNAAYEQWIKNYKVSNIKMSTFSKTEGYFKNHILPFFGEKKLTKITVAMCEDFAIELSKKLKYFHHIVNYASDVFETAINHSYIHANPFTRAKIPKENSYIQNDNFLHVEDLKLIIDALPTLNFKARALLRLLIFSGMRKGEALALKWNNIDFNKKQIEINAAYSYSKYNEGKNVGPTKNKISRTIPLDSNTLQTLLEWKELQAIELNKLGLTKKHDSEQLIFNNTVNNHLKITYPNDYLNVLLEKTGAKKITVHGLRHTHITHLMESQAELIGVKHRVGHTNNNSTTETVYIHITDKIKNEVLQCLLDYYKEFDIK